MQAKQIKIIVLLFTSLVITSCGNYVPPPEVTTIEQELQIEYDRCLKINKNRNCAQLAYDVVRVVKGLEPRPIPKGYVVILQGEGEHLSSEAEKAAEKKAAEEKAKKKD